MKWQVKKTENGKKLTKSQFPESIEKKAKSHLVVRIYILYNKDLEHVIMETTCKFKSIVPTPKN